MSGWAALLLLWEVRAEMCRRADQEASRQGEIEFTAIKQAEPAPFALQQYPFRASCRAEEELGGSALAPLGSLHFVAQNCSGVPCGAALSTAPAQQFALLLEGECC